MLPVALIIAGLIAIPGQGSTIDPNSLSFEEFKSNLENPAQLNIPEQSQPETKHRCEK